jgi:flavin-dependent dehydrogenase
MQVKESDDCGVREGREMESMIEIAGAGPSGLAAALTIAQRGGDAIVYERHADVGQRFHGDFQGLENWTTEGDVLEEMASNGIEPTFEHTPFREMVLFDPTGREHVFRSERPIWYLIRRGSEPGTLDQALKAQTLDAGVEIRFKTLKEHMPHGGIVAHGPHKVDAIAVGYIFESPLADGAFAAVSEELAPKGYSYLLICGGRATIASCMFADFHNEKEYLQRTVDFFREKVGIDLVNARRFGGFGNLRPLGRARKGKMLYVGEGAGFQDALFGFGLRYAMLSGHLAARALLDGRPADYDGLLSDRLGGLMKASVVNRYLYDKLGNRGYVRLASKIDRKADVRDWLRRYYGPGWVRSLLYPLARRRVAHDSLVGGCDESCDCTWCRCRGHAAPA